MNNLGKTPHPSKSSFSKSQLKRTGKKWLKRSASLLSMTAFFLAMGCMISTNAQTTISQIEKTPTEQVVKLAPNIDILEHIRIVNSWQEYIKLYMREDNQLQAVLVFSSVKEEEEEIPEKEHPPIFNVSGQIFEETPNGKISIAFAQIDAGEAIYFTDEGGFFSFYTEKQKVIPLSIVAKNYYTKKGVFPISINQEIPLIKDPNKGRRGYSSIG